MVTTLIRGAIPETTAKIEATLETPLSPQWNKVPGISVSGRRVCITPEEYFFCYEDPSWILCNWDKVEREMLHTEESEQISYEQRTLDFVRDNGYRANNGGEVLETAEKVYKYIFRDEHLNDPGLADVTPRHLQILREMGTIMALNRVELTGHISNVGPAWFFPLCSQRVYELDEEQAHLVDELYHGTFFNEPRRVESVKAHAALGGRLVHGCQSSPNMSGGCVVAYGTDIAGFYRELQAFKAGWMDRIRRF